MKNKSSLERSQRILNQLQKKYPGKTVFDLDEEGQHFICEIEPSSEHSEFDRAVEVIIKSRPHKHQKMKQRYTIVSGHLELHIGSQIQNLGPGETYTITPGTVHWATSHDECWVEIYSEPGWTKEDHILVTLQEN